KDSGVVKVFNKEVSDVTEDVGIVFDGSTFSGDLTVTQLQHVLSQTYSNWDDARYTELLNRFNLALEKKIRTFSRGMIMKLSIIVALSHGAKLLILDEATGGLDVATREEVLDLLVEFVSEEDNSILMSSHISGDLEKIADNITFIDEGKIIFQELKDKLVYEYAIARMKDADFEKLQTKEFIAARKRGLQYEVLVGDKEVFASKYPNIEIGNARIDEVLTLISNSN
ncbi:MAG: ABC transporter, partial [Epulopiscium sp. Nele67-Bin002]